MTFQNLKIALISDSLTSTCLKRVCKVQDLTPLNYKLVLKYWKPDLLFTEATWHGWRKRWQYKVASFPDHRKRNNRAFQNVAAYARDLNIPSLFWNREDGVHFERFIDSASCFDHIFTVDSNCIEKYKARIPHTKTVNALMFAAEPSLHYPSADGFKYKRACFLGSYSLHVHDQRRHWQDMLFQAAAPLGLTVFDRNSDRKSDRYRYPELSWMDVKKSLPHDKTPAAYRDYMVSLNVNTVTDSDTMFSRRLVEIMSCGGITVTTPAQSVTRLFADHCHIVSSTTEANDLLARFARDGASPQDISQARAAAAHVHQHHSWSNRLMQIMDTISI